MIKVHISTQCYDVLTQCVSPLHSLAHLVMWPRCSGPMVMQKGLFELEVCGLKWDIIPYVGQLVLFNVPVDWWIIDPYIYTLINGASQPVNGGVWNQGHQHCHKSPKAMAQVYGWQSKRQTTAIHSYNTSPPLTLTRSLLQRPQTQMDLYLFWTS